jgi:hypothetical protein
LQPRVELLNLIYDLNFAVNAGFPDFSGYNIPKRGKIPNNQKKYQMDIKYTNWL